jgi:hypothetical protein
MSMRHRQANVSGVLYWLVFSTYRVAMNRKVENRQTRPIGVR